MQKIMLYIRTLLENTLFWLGGVAFFMLVCYFFYAPFEEALGVRYSFAFYAVLTLLVGALMIWVLAARRKALGTQISTAVYVLLNLIPIIAIGALILMWISSFD